MEYNESLDQVHEKSQDADTKSDNGKAHEDRGLTSDAESFMEKWLQSVRIKNDTPLHGHLIRFLAFVGVDDQEGAEALAASLKEIVRMIGDEWTPPTNSKPNIHLRIR